MATALYVLAGFGAGFAISLIVSAVRQRLRRRAAHRELDEMGTKFVSVLCENAKHIEARFEKRIGETDTLAKRIDGLEEWRRAMPMLVELQGSLRRIADCERRISYLETALKHEKKPTPTKRRPRS